MTNRPQELTVNPLKKIGIISAALLFLSTSVYSDVHFDKLNGTDLGMGTGARAMAMSGAFTALADDSTAVYWNPAGLSKGASNELSASMYYPTDLSALTLSLKPPIPLLKQLNVAMGFSLINRLRLKGDSGPDDTWDGYPSQILDLSMIEVGEGFSGSLDSKTIDKRISLAFDIPYVKNLSIGINFVSIE